MTKDKPARQPAVNPPAVSPPGDKGGAGANPLWGGRFERGPAEAMARINASIDFDRALYAQDIRASLAHAAMLARRKIISDADEAAIRSGLGRILGEIESGTFVFRRELEDIHMNIETRLAELIGDAAGRLHTARSRNDQVATDFRLWIRDRLDRLDGELQALQAALLGQAEAHWDSVMPGFTHLQAAQPVTLGHHLLAYVEMLGRDRGRAKDARRRLNESPLGAGALAGTSFPIDRQATAAALGFERPMANSIDAVSDRDFAVEFLATAALIAVHLSRLCEEIVVWSSAQFGFVALSGAYTTGSSMMPQKRNPDGAELVRAKTGRVVGNLVGLLTALKGLPLAYSKDMQEDKEPVFAASETLSASLAVCTGMVADMTVDTARLAAAAESGHTTATDLADWLVQTLDMPFRQAHHVTGRIVKLADEKSCRLAELALADLRAIDPRITEKVYGVLTVENSVASRTSEGGTAPVAVREAVRRAKERYL